MINNKRPITAYEFDIIEFIRKMLKEATEQVKNQQKPHAL